MDDQLLRKVSDLLRRSKYTTAFTGAGISVESGIPPFRGENGLWNKYDPKSLDLGFFYAEPLESWKVIVEIFYEFFGNAKPNGAHTALGKLEKQGMIKAVITQNIDNLHREGGSSNVIEFHGNAKQLVCTLCHRYFKPDEVDLKILPVTCTSCNGLVKPDFVFFGENIPSLALQRSLEAAENSEVMLVIGTTAEVMPAGQMPMIAKSKGATIVEINPEPSHLTRYITDIYLQGNAAEIMDKLTDLLLK
jgi:NAD-dependent deacetylase